MTAQIPLDPAAILEVAYPDDGTIEISSDMAYRRLLMVNVIFYGLPSCGDRRWVLVDTGLHGFAQRISSIAEGRFGEDSRPAAIILTHGHADHSGCAAELAEKWDAPIYAHPAEHPFLNGTEAYPPANPNVGGLIAWMSPLFPRGPFDLSRFLQPLPADGSVPGMTGWRWIHTPGHAPGHVSLWRGTDRSLIVGDAFITTHQESAFSVAVQKPEMHGPPQFQTPDWTAARESVKALQALKPERVISGHGRAMHGPNMRYALRDLAERFDQVAVPH